MTPEGSIDFRKLPQWINWFPDKVPCQVDCLHTAKINDPNHFRSYEKAIEGSKRHQVAGVGFVFTADDGLMGIDLDDIYPLQHERYKHLRELAKQTYAERSPSGNGEKIWIVGKRPDWAVGHKKNFRDGTQIEWYDRNRYFTYTGNKLEGHPDVANHCPELIECLRQWFEPKAIDVGSQLPLADRLINDQGPDRFMQEDHSRGRLSCRRLPERFGMFKLGRQTTLRHSDWETIAIFELMKKHDYACQFTDDWTAAGNETVQSRRLAAMVRFPLQRCFATMTWMHPT